MQQSKNFLQFCIKIKIYRAEKKSVSIYKTQVFPNLHIQCPLLRVALNPEILFSSNLFGFMIY
jgi:hypothetical protein